MIPGFQMKEAGHLSLNKNFYLTTLKPSTFSVGGFFIYPKSQINSGR